MSIESIESGSELSQRFTAEIDRFLLAAAKDCAVKLERVIVEWMANAGPGAHLGELILESHQVPGGIGHRDVLRVRAGAHWSGAGAGPILAEWSMAEWMSEHGLATGGPMWGEP